MVVATVCVVDLRATTCRSATQKKNKKYSWLLVALRTCTMIVYMLRLTVRAGDAHYQGQEFDGRHR